MNKTILVVDDDSMIRLVICDALQENGFNTIELESGAQVMKTLKDNDIALLIMDIMMEEKEGVETLLEVRNDYPDLPVLMVSSDTMYLDLTRQLGSTALIPKPIDQNYIVDLVKQYTDN